MNANPLPVLVVEDDADLREALADTLRIAAYRTLEVPDGEAALALLERQRVGLVLTDVQMQPMDGYTLLREIKARYPYVPVLVMTAYGVIDKAVEAMRAGAADYLTKPFEPERVLAAIARYMLPPEGGGLDAPVAVDPRTAELLGLARRVAATPATVLLTGESGTGKEVLARYVHAQSPRAGKPFVAVNCAAIPENLLEATLFGYEKGAFTGATQASPGKFEQADGGTLFLDEVSEMPLPLQAKLLRALQEREVERVGGRKPVSVDIRVVAASNRDLPEAVRRGAFREDLYYRLNVFPLEIPPLRSRPADILPLAQAFLRRHAAALGRPGLRLAPAAAARLTGYGWPGNIRELENVIQRAMILAPGGVIEADHLYLPETRQAPVATAEAETRGPTDMKSLERDHILQTLAKVNGSRKQAAQELGMSERTLRYKLAQYRAEGYEG